mmetsp:Transcript_963/g.1246  ORF Transcript_963/g.1246 Transcript_963/m.1246 type:complete len:108 (-) Transcript_963:133-456(-)
MHSPVRTTEGGISTVGDASEFLSSEGKEDGEALFPAFSPIRPMGDYSKKRVESGNSGDIAPLENDTFKQPSSLLYKSEIRTAGMRAKPFDGENRRRSDRYSQEAQSG